MSDNNKSAQNIDDKNLNLENQDGNTDQNSGGGVGQPEKTVPLTALQEERTKRQEAQKKYEELMAKIEEQENQRKAEEGKFKELYEKSKSEIEGFKERLQEYESYKKKYEEFESQTRTELLEQLEGDELKTIANKLTIEDLRSFVKLHSKSNTDKSFSVGKKKDMGEKPKTFSEWKNKY